MTSFVAGLSSELVKIAEKEKRTLRDAVPLLAGLGAGALAYGISRKQSLSSNPVLRAIQQKSRGHLTIVDTLAKGKQPGIFSKLLKKVTRGADEVVEVPYSRWNKQDATPLSNAKFPGAERVSGAVMPQAHSNQVIRGYKGDVDIASNVVGITRLENKLNEARMLRRYIPSAVAETIPITLSRGKTDEGKLRALQKQLWDKFPNGFIIKPLDTAASGSVITYQDSLVNIAKNRGDIDPMHRGWVKEMLRKPEDFIAQEFIDIDKDRVLIGEGGILGHVPAEYRVHTIDGVVLPNATHHRWSVAADVNPFSRFLPEIGRVNEATQKYLSKIPRDKLKGIPMGLDVVRRTDGKYHIIETNPGGGSGFIAPEQSMIPSLTGHEYYKAITGRSSPALATAKGVLTGAGAGVGTQAVMRRGRSRGERRRASRAARG